MPTLKIHNPKDFSKILAIIEKFQNGRNAAWYRGVGNESYHLVPTLMRRAVKPTPEELKTIEKDISARFSQRSPPFIQVNFDNEWRSLFFMQHYGIPTRLLDWSESPFVGLYFALTSVARDSAGQPLSDVALWMCDPEEWNKTALAHITFKGGVLDETCEEIKSYHPSVEVDQRFMLPIMIYGTHNSPRIVAQRGVFALFGKGIDGMDQVFTQPAFANDCLHKVVIDKGVVGDILESLHRKGFTESTIYPDLFGLSLEIKRTFGYI